MSGFTDILLHARRLQGATKDLSIDDLKDAQEKLAALIEKRIEMLAQEEALRAEKAAQIEAIKQQMFEAGLDISDFETNHGSDNAKSTRRRGAKRPIKYSITVDGVETNWTGIGRMPVIFAQALEAGKSLEDFSV